MTPGRHVDDTTPPDGPPRTAPGAAGRRRAPEQIENTTEQTEQTAGQPREHTTEQTTPQTGSVLPNRSKDDVDAAWGDADGGWNDDERFLREVPPHW